MKKLLAVSLVTLLFLSSFPNNVQAQEGYEGKRVYLDLGIGFSRYGLGNNVVYNSYGFNSFSLPVLRANLEYGFNHFISGGLYAGYNHYGYKETDTYLNTTYDYLDRVSHFVIGARATFHIWAFLNKQLDLGLGVNQLDLYASIMTGARIRTETVKDVNFLKDPPQEVKTKNRRVRPHFGPTVGAKYYFANNVSVFLEAGYAPLSFGLFGVGFKF